jgi:hypothetical protein
MAGAIIPIVSSLAPVVAQLLPGIIRAVEGIFTAPKSGPQKMAAALDLAQAAIGSLTEKTQVKGAESPPTADALRAMIETELARLKASGELTPPLALPAVPGGPPITFERFDGWLVRQK